MISHLNPKTLLKKSPLPIQLLKMKLNSSNPIQANKILLTIPNLVALIRIEMFTKTSKTLEKRRNRRTKVKEKEVTLTRTMNLNQKRRDEREATKTKKTKETKTAIEARGETLFKKSKYNYIQSSNHVLLFRLVKNHE